MCSMWSTRPSAAYPRRWRRAATAVVVVILWSAPYFLKAVRDGRAFRDLFGITEGLSGKRYAPVAQGSEKVPRGRSGSRNRILVWMETAVSVLRWTVPGFEVDFGQSECRPPWKMLSTANNNMNGILTYQCSLSRDT